MATNIYLQLKDIKGESTDTNHKEWLEVLSFSHSFTQPTSPSRSTAGGGTVERATHADFTISKYLDASTDDLIKACWAGKTIATAQLQAYRSDGEGNKAALYLQVDFEQVVISNYSISGGPGDIPTENVSLSYGKVTYSYYPQSETDGTQGTKEQASHDLKSNEIQ
jgi:type VI secretion system secreted protein Hcp